MSDRDKHRYRIWEYGKHLSLDDEPLPAAVEKRIFQVTQRPPAIVAEELTGIMSLYEYRPSIQAQLPATCESATGAPLNCKTATIAPDAVQLVYTSTAGKTAEPRESAEHLPEGSGVRLHVEEVGSLAGVIAAKKPEGFRVNIDREYHASVGDRIARLAAKHVVAIERGAAMSSKITAVEPAVKRCQFLDHTGTLREGTIVNISDDDALIRARIIPPERSRIFLRGTIQRPADVVRVFEIAFALKFVSP
jgi:hypothetical protein